MARDAMHSMQLLCVASEVLLGKSESRRVVVSFGVVGSMSLEALWEERSFDPRRIAS